MSFILPLSKAAIVYMIEAVANSTIPITAVPTDISIMLVILVDTYLVVENNSNALYMNTTDTSSDTMPGNP